MKHFALAIAAALTLALVAPAAFAQPFADVPADHWAFDAIAELAAKGILEGFPDGTFKGDRAMTRYEMAMALARILARIEAIKIPPPPKIPPPEVRRADIDRLQRLINEFRAELSALGVRITAVEEQLAAIKARLDNVRVTGDSRIRYNIFLPLLTSVFTCPDGSPGPCSFFPPTSLQIRNRLTFTGRVGDVSAVIRMTTAPSSGSSQITGGGLFGTFDTIRFDRAYTDFPLLTLTWRVGRFGYTLSGVTSPSGYGLLYDPDNAGAGPSSTGASDGILAKGTFGGFNVEAGLFRDASWQDVWTGRIETGSIIPGWTFGLSAISQRRNWGAAAGSGGFLPNGQPVTDNQSDTGWSFDVQGTLMPALSLSAAWASFDPADTPGFPAGIFRSSSAWTVLASLDLGQLGGLSQFSPKLQAWYKNYGNWNSTDGYAFGPLWSGAVTEFFGALQWNFKGWGAQLDVQLTPKLSGTLIYESGSDVSDNTFIAHFTTTELFAGVTYSLAPRTSLLVNYRYETLNLPNVPLDFGKVAHQYRVQLSFSF